MVWMVWVAWTAWMALTGGNAYAQVPAAGAPRGGGATTTSIAPPAENCQLVVSEPDMNYGAVTRYRLEQGVNGQEMSLGKRRITLSVSCRTPVRLAVRFRGPSAGADYLFGQQGKVVMRLVEPRLDGRNVLVGAAQGAGMMPAAPASAARFLPDQAIVPVEGGQPAVGTQFSATIEVDPLLPQEAARVRNRTSLELDGSFEVLWR